MIWLTWRQLRANTAVASAVLVLGVAALATMGGRFALLWTESGAAACPATGECAALDSFVSRASAGWPAAVYLLGTGLIFLVPPLVGVFWGAPMVARELESGTHRLVWNQSITPARWLATKLAVAGAAAVAFAGLLSLVATLSSSYLDTAGFNRLRPELFGARGIVPMAYAAFAFALGVVIGTVLRRTVPAMAATLSIYAGVVLAAALGLRAHLLPMTHSLTPLVLGEHPDFTIGGDGHMEITADVELPGAWVVHNDAVTTSGQVFHGPADPAVCGRDASPRGCMDWVASLGLQQRVDYHPAGQFWPLQLAESGVFVALTALLVAFGFWWLRRRPA